MAKTKTPTTKEPKPHKVTVVFQLPHDNYQKLIEDIKNRYKTYAYYFVEPIITTRFSKIDFYSSQSEDEDG